MCFDIGPNKYEDPSTFENNSIHHSFSEVFNLFFIRTFNQLATTNSKTSQSRFVTVHGTHNAQVRGNTGYITRGHGYFIEDGNEKGTVFDGNLGMVAHQGIILPTDKGTPLCQNATEGTRSRLSPDGSGRPYLIQRHSNPVFYLM